MTSNYLQTISEKFRAMGTDVGVDIIVDSSATKDDARKAAAAVKNIFAQNEKIFSRFRADSELSQMNMRLDAEIKLSAAMAEVLELCLKFYKLSGGYFDPRIIGNLEKIGYDRDFKSNDPNSPEEIRLEAETFKNELDQDLILDKDKQSAILKKRIDTTGIAKGFTVDQAARYLEEKGFKNFIVDAGGDMAARGDDSGKEGWLIGIEGLEDDRLLLRLKAEGIATSGISRKRWQKGGRKFHHLINPKEPENFSFDIKTVTVIEKQTVEADGRAKVLVLMGKDNGMEFANRNNIKALFLDYTGNVHLSEAIKENVIKNF